MGSSIELNSTLGQGSVFSFSLYLLETHPTFLENMEFLEGSGSLDLSGSRILFVEDVNFNRIIGERFLSKWKVNFDSATNSDEAISFANENPYDLILMDLQLPDRNGYETVRIIRKSKLNKLTPVLAMTASGYYEIQDKLKQNNIQGYISKPFISQDLKNTLVEWIGKKTRKGSQD
jgi:CheY-like chemotaxis protein